MTIKNSTLFISDLHLDPGQPHIIKTFFYFLEKIAPTADALYILGDCFESYIGDDEKNKFIESITEALRTLSDKGVPIFFMHGNRDFLVGQRFASRANVTLISDPLMITLYNQFVLLMHGDSLCTDDHGHQRFRKITRHTAVQKIFLLLPLSFRQKIAKKLRETSQQHNRMKRQAIMDVNEVAVSEALKTHHAAYLIHGHTHRPMLSDTRIVLGAWHESGNYLRISSDGKKEWVVMS